MPKRCPASYLTFHFGLIAKDGGLPVSFAIKPINANLFAEESAPLVDPVRVAERRGIIMSEVSSNLSPMGIRQSIVVFGIPTLAFTFVLWFVQPYLVGQGMLPFHAQLWTMYPLFGAMILAAFGLSRREGHGMGFQERLRFQRLGARGWIYALLAFVFAFIGFGIIANLMLPLLTDGTIPILDVVPESQRPTTSSDQFKAMDEGFGGLKGNWIALLLFIGLLFLNVFGEEVFWRGYVLPRQEAAFGALAWPIHGVMWALFHSFKYWDVPALLPMTLALAFVVWRTRNTNVGLVIHGLYNGIAIIPITMMVMGIMG